MRTYLIDLRKKRGLTQSKTSEALKISRSYYSAIELGSRNPTLNLAKRIADFFGESTEAIFFS